MGCHSLIQRIFLTQESNPDLLHHRQILYHLNYQESAHGPPKKKKNVGAMRVAQKKPMVFFICQATTHYSLFRPTTKLYTLAARDTSLSAFFFLFTNLRKYSQISHFKDTAKSSTRILMMMKKRKAKFHSMNGQNFGGKNLKTKNKWVGFTS